MKKQNLKTLQLTCGRWLAAVTGGGCFLLVTLLKTVSSDAAEPPTVDAEESRPAFTAAERHFTIKVLPLLKEKCFGCHGADPEDLRGDFDMRSRASLLRGGQSEDPPLVPGAPDESPIMDSIRWESNEMPPKENDRLTEEQITQVEQWIRGGALWPSEETRRQILRSEREVIENEEGRLVSTSGGLSDEWTYRRYQPREIWAFLPLRRPASGGMSGSHAIDFFVNKKLQKFDLKPTVRADPRTLVRRAYFDLVGLPPSPEQVCDFLSRWERGPAAAWSGLIDELLESSHYGERWAQHWLDVVRYADTGGMSNDYERSNAWRYRDYVIRAFNDDKPYDQFVVEQIAGDELAMQESSADQAKKVDGQNFVTPLDSEKVVATGFLRMGPWDTAMIPPAEARQIYRDDVVHSLGQSFLSMPMRCCKCHDHKFDPIPTQDYYRLYAAFSATQPIEVRADFLPKENLNHFDEGRASVQALLGYAKERVGQLVAKREATAKQWYKDRNRKYKNLKARKNDPDDQKPPRHCGLSEEEQGRLKVREQDVWIWTRRLERYEPLAQSVFNGPDFWQNARKLRKPKRKSKRSVSADEKEGVQGEGGAKDGLIQTSPSAAGPQETDNPLQGGDAEATEALATAGPEASKYEEPQDWKPRSFIFLGGDHSAEGPPVTPGVLSGCGLSVEGAPSDDPFALPTSIDGRRLALARWIADPRNPLTARSFVNRIWQHHFGQGLVRTANNFGAKGDAPSHPELLDWLACEFVEGGMTSKRMHRMIMMSDTYLRSTVARNLEHLDAVDAGNRLLSHFRSRRLTAEEIRDTLLVVSGELNEEVGGLPAMPEINLEVALEPRMIQFSLAPAYQPSPSPQQRNRRSIYAYRVRGQADPFMEVMNKPGPNDSCDLRDDAAVSPQAFTLLNSEVVSDRSIALALRLQRDADTVEKQIDRAYQLVLGRPVSDRESTRLTQYVKQMQSYHQDRKPAKIKYPTQITRSLVEEFSGKPFEYTEWLPHFENYISDKKPSDVDANTRALADLCLLLFNTNEFLYVY